MEVTAKVPPTDSAGVSTYLPDHPVVSIKAGRKWFDINLREVWQYRELLYFLIWRDVKVLYKQTFLGVIWVLLQPILTMIVTSMFFGKLIGVPSDGLPYALFVFSALLPWMFFSRAVTQSGNSLISSSNLITKVYFPRMIVPMAAVLAGLVDFSISFVAFASVMAYYKVAPTLNMLFLPVVIFLTILFALSMGIWLSALNVKYRDFRVVIPVMLQVGMFVTPIFYPLSIIPENKRWMMSLNPLAGLIEGYRASLFGLSFHWTRLFISTLVILASLVCAIFIFRRMENHFADVI
jgi:lipopolysaccharide transport system permease protein